MKIKFGSIIENINQMNNDIYSNQTPSEERIYIDFKDTHHTAQEIVEMINTNYTGTLTIVYEDDIEKSFAKTKSPKEWLEKMLESLHENEKENNDNYSAIAVEV